MPRAVELAKLAADRKHAEDELADRRKAVALQQTEASRLETVASQAHDAADREETRRADLAKQRTAEEHELDQLEARKQSIADAQARADAQRVQQQVATAKPADKHVKSTAIGAIDFHGNEDSSQVDIAVGDGAVVTVGEVTRHARRADRRSRIARTRTRADARRLEVRQPGEGRLVVPRSQVAGSRAARRRARRGRDADRRSRRGHRALALRCREARDAHDERAVAGRRWVRRRVDADRAAVRDAAAAAGRPAAHLSRRARRHRVRRTRR